MMDVLNQILQSSKNTRKKIKGFKKLNCNPKNLTSKSKGKTKSKKNSYSCLDTKTIVLMKDLWNKRHPDMKIKSKNRKAIWEKLKVLMKDTCENESCWLEKTITNKSHIDSIMKESFAPRAPESWKSNINEWLSSLDIKKVMKQYEAKYSDFSFFGPSPIDFDENIGTTCVWPELCHLNIKNLIKNKKYKLGFVFNTDKHYQSGSHWIAMYIDLKSKKIFYFDSNGNPMPIQIKAFISKIEDQCKKLKLKMKVDSNEGFRHQESNTECGMYCLYFIISLLEKKKSMKSFKEKVINDDEVEELRHAYFNLV